MRLLRRIAFAAFLFGLAVLPGCASQASGTGPTPALGVSIAVPCDEFQKSAQPVVVARQAKLQVGQSLTVTLCANPSTGFSWEEPKVANTAVLAAVGSQEVAAATPVPGAAGQQVFTFKALAKGTTNVVFAYSRPWQGGEKGVWKVDLAVTVE